MSIYSTIHPQLRFRGRLMRLFLGDYSVGFLRIAGRMCRLMGRKRAKKLNGMRVEPVSVDLGSRKLKMNIYRPLNNVSEVPGLMWIHGGGYAMGFPEQDESFIRHFIETVPCIVIAPAYRLSPEEPYPAALDDCYAALLWLHEHADELGVRRDRIMVGGDSAGGGLTAAVTIRARREGKVAIACQMPLYPMLDDRMITGSSRENRAPVWSSRSNESAWKLYLGKLHGRDDIPAEAVPARLTDYSGLPPAFTFVGSIEPFRDEVIEYMENLRSAGVPAEYTEFNGCYHAFDIMAPDSEPARNATALLLDYFRRAAE